MKKFLSVILSAVLFIGTLAIGTGASAATKAAAPAVKIGSTLELDIAPVDLKKTGSLLNSMESIEDAEKMMDDFDVWYGKITPAETGYYEFVFDTEYKCKGIKFEDLLKDTGFYDEDFDLLDDEITGTVSACAAGIVDSKSNDKGSGISMNLDFGDTDSDTDEMLDMAKGLIDTLSFGKTPSFTAKLKQGKTYYLTIVNLSASNYKTKLKIAKHKHTLKNVNQKATYKYDKTFEMNWGEEGFKGKKCSCGYCEYKKGKTFPAVLSVEINDTLYTGKKLTPQVTVYLENGKKLNKKFYTVKYTNNKNYGSGKAVIRFKGNYKGKAVERFNIVPKAVGITEVKAKKKTATVKWKKSAEKISGYQIEYGTNKYFSDSKTVNVKGVKNTVKTFKKLKKPGKKYYFRIRAYKVVNGDKYFSEWSKTKKFKKK